MAKIIFLGTASSIPTKTRDNTSLLFIDKKLAFLIDCPGAIVQKLLKARVDFRKLHNVIITHHHPDHIYGIISLIHTQYLLNDRLNIYSNDITIRMVKKLVRIFKLNRKGFPKIKYFDVFKSNRKGITPPFYRQKNLKLTAIKNKHAKDSFGIRCAFGKKSLLYTSDTSFYPSMLRKEKNINYLIHDCTASSAYFKKHPSLYTMHTNAKQVAQYLEDKPQIKLIPVHFLLLRKDEEKRIRKELSSLKNTLFVKDFQTIYL